MKIIADTNILARAVLADDAKQTAAARKVLAEAELIVVPLVCLCELVWLLDQGFKVPRRDIAASIRALIDSGRVLIDQLGTGAGLAFLDDGGDFADGAIAAIGEEMGGEIFMSFDRDAVRRLKAMDVEARSPFDPRR